MVATKSFANVFVYIRRVVLVVSCQALLAAMRSDLYTCIDCKELQPLWHDTFAFLGHEWLEPGQKTAQSTLCCPAELPRVGRGGGGATITFRSC